MIGQPWRRRVALGIGAAGIAACLIGFAATVDGETFSARTLVLAGCAAAASVGAVPLTSNVAVSGYFALALLAAVYINPAAGVVVVAIAELVTFVVLHARGKRYRSGPLLINLGGSGAPTLLVGLVYGAMVDESAGPDAATSVLLAVLAVAGLLLNVLLTMPAMSLYDGLSISSAIRSFGAPFPGLAANAILFACVGPLYDELGTVGLVSAIVLVLLATYVSRLALNAQVREQRIGQLASARAELVRELVDVESLERRRLADRLHDGPLQSALAARDDVRAALDGHDERLVTAAEALAEVAKDLRVVASDLWGVEPRVPVSTALRELADRQAATSGQRVVVRELEYESTEHDDLVLALARELLVNAERHSGASMVEVRLTTDPEHLLLEVLDDGVGISDDRRARAARHGHIGLASIDARVRAVDGRFEIAEISNGAGTRARVKLPNARRKPGPATQTIPLRGATVVPASDATT